MLLLQLALLLMQTLSEVLIELVFESYHEQPRPTKAGPTLGLISVAYSNRSCRTRCKRDWSSGANCQITLGGLPAIAFEVE